MDIGSQTSTSGTINTLWRALLSSPSQLILARILKANLETILVNFHKAGLVDLSQEEIVEVTHAPEDLNKICYLIFAKHYGSGTTGGGPIRKMCQSIQRPEHMSRLDMSTSQVSALRRRAEDLVCACSALVHCRNVNAHEHYPIDDPGFALMLAGSITRIIEVAEISEDQQRPAERLRRQCDEILRASVKMSADDDEQSEKPVASNLDSEDAEQIVTLLTSISTRIDQIDQTSPGSRNEATVTPPSRNKETITANDLGAKFITGQIKRENSALASKISSQLREMPTIEEIEMIVQSVVRKSLDSTHNEVHLEDQLGQLMERFQSGIEEIRSSIADSSSQTKEETRAQQSLIDRKMSELQNIVSNSQPNRSVVDVSDAYFLEDEGEYETTSAPPAITPQQARNQLFQLRNQIRDEQEAEGTPIDNWENIVQGPIIERMIGNRISTLEDWKNEPTISYKYERNREVMDRQLERYQSMIFAVMKQIET
jgi:hypothetical protein